MKKFTLVTFLLALSFILVSITGYANSSWETDKNEDSCNLPSVVKSEKFIVPVKAITKALGAEVELIRNSEVIIKRNDVKVHIELNTGTMSINGNKIKPGDYLASQGNKKAVPVSFISDILDKKIIFDNEPVKNQPGDSSYIFGKIELTPEHVVLSNNNEKDWIHWGLDGSTGVNRKSGVDPKISHYSVIGSNNVCWFSGIPVSYSWTCGDPIESVSGTATSVYVTGIGNGFEVTVPADTNARTLKTYIGAWGTKAKVEASLSDGSGCIYEGYVDTTADIACKVVTLDFRADTDNQTLTVKYTVENVYNENFGNISLHAAVLY